MKKILLTLPLLLIMLFTEAQFGSKFEISKSNTAAQDAKCYDLDNDGDLDVITASNTNGKIAWHQNLGAGVFSSQITITREADGARFVHCEDLDNDGDLDILVASGFNFVNGKITWHENLGGGVFGSQQIISTAVSYPNSVYSADLDGDGDMDVLSTSENDNKVAWYENLGAGVFGIQQIISTNAVNAIRVQSGDLDNDGDMDVLSASPNDNKLVWYKNLGNGSFGSEQLITVGFTAYLIQDIHIDDIDNDGDLDVFAATANDDKISWYENLGGGSFGPQQTITTLADFAKGVFMADLDGDSDLDVISASNYDDKIAWYENTGGGVFGPQQYINNPDVDGQPFNGIEGDANAPTSVFAGDLNGDGNIDVIATSSADDKIMWYENLGGGIFGAQQLFSPTLVHAESVHAEDLDGDGLKDVLTASNYDHKISWYKNLGNGAFDDQRNISTTAYKAQDVFAADFDGDGDMDVLAGAKNNCKVSWYKNLGSGSFGSENIIYTGLSNDGEGIYAADLNGDGDIDVLTTNINADRAAWHENLGGGLFGPQQTITLLADGIVNVYAKDLDNDGDLDVLTAAIHNGLAWFENLGVGSFGPKQAIFTGTVQAVSCADLDGDGLQDVMSCSQGGTIAWYKNMGGGIFSGQQIIELNAAGPEDVIAYDIDGDGDMDIVSASQANNDNEIVWYENLGAGSFGSRVYIEQGYYEFGSSLFSADMDGDGDRDLLATFHDGEVFMYKNYYNSPYQLKGSSFYDANQNSIFDTAEIGFAFIQTQTQPFSLASFTNATGNYRYAVDTGTYTVGYSPLPLWNLTTDSTTYTRTLTGANPIIDSLDFGFYPNTITTDITPTLTGALPRCNTIVNYWLNYKNTGTTIPSGVLHLQLDDSITYVGSPITPDSIVGQNIYWTYNNLFFFSDSLVNVDVLMPPFTNMLDTLTSYLTIHELDGGNNITYSNTDTLKQVSICAYDPNDKKVTPKGLGKSGYILNNQEMEYLIRFQNTGNDTALTVMVRDQLDSDLDWGSLEIIASSHAVQAWTELNGEAVFKFEGIMLPDSGADYLGSQGFIRFKINLDNNLAPGTTINNTSHIYFDSNPAVITNTVLNTIYDCDIVPINVANITCFGEEFISFSEEGDINTYTWNIDAFYASSNDTLSWLVDTVGTFNLTMTSTNFFCMKDTTISLTVLPAIPFTNASTSICLGDSMLLGGSYQFSAGIYNDTLQSVLSCDSILSTTLNINSSYFISDTIELCLGDSALIFGNYYTASGLFFDSLQTLLGCDSVFAAELIVNVPNGTPPSFTMNPSSVVICDGAPTSLNLDLGCGASSSTTCGGPSAQSIVGTTWANNISTTYPAPYGNRYKSAKHQFLFTVAELNSAGITGGKITEMAWEITQINGDTVFNDYQIKMGCTSINSLTSQFENGLIPVFGSPYAVQNIQVTTGWNTHVFDAAYEWDGVSNLIVQICFDNPGATLNCKTPMTQTSFTSTIVTANMVTNICAATSSSWQFAYRPITRFTSCASTPDPNLYNYTWTPGLGLSDSLIKNPTVNTSVPTTYYVTVTDTFCNGRITDSVVVNIGTSVNLNQALAICQGDSILLAGTYQTTGGVFVDTLQAVNSCDSTITTTLTVNPLPNVSLASFNPDTLCNNTNSVILPIGLPVGGNYSGNGVVGGTFDPITAGVGIHNIIYTYTDVNSCINSDTTIVTVKTCTGINNITTDFGIIIYPNPSTGQFTIEKPNDLNKEVQIKLLDATSRLIIEKVIPIDNKKVEMDIRDYSTGIYYLYLIIDDQQFVKQILKN